jgi:hypothetical protein
MGMYTSVYWIDIPSIPVINAMLIVCSLSPDDEENKHHFSTELIPTSVVHPKKCF